MKAMTVLRHLIGYLGSHDDVCISLKWTGRTHGLFHEYPAYDSNENVLEVFTDADWASDRLTRRSVSA